MTATDPFLLAADFFDPPPNPYQGDPVGWIQDRLGEHVWSKQRDVAQSVVDHRYTAVKSCHNAGKSFIASRLAAWWLDTHPPGEAFVVTTAPSFPQVRAILWREISKARKAAAARGHALPGRVNQTEWFIGEEIVAYGRKPADYDQTAFQGIHAKYVLVLIDEASGIPKPLFDAVDALATNEHARVLAIGNPDDPVSHFERICKPGSGWNVIRIDGLQTPNFTDEPVPESLRPMLLSPVWVEERRKRWGEDSPLFIAKVRGEFPDVSDDTLIPLGWITRAQQAELDRDGAPAIEAVDVARFGSDESVFGIRTGPIFRVVKTTTKQATTQTTGEAINVYRDHDAAEVRVDGVGVGGGVVDQLAEQRYPVVDMQAGQAAIDTEHFSNARAEWWWGLRQRFEDGDIDIDPADDELAAQLAQMKFKFTSRGQIRIESKDDMRKRGLPSPDRADTAMLAFAHVPDEVPELEIYEEVHISPV